MENIDISKSSIQRLAQDAIRILDDAKVITLLMNTDSVTRTLAAQELQVRGSDDIFNKAVELLNHPVDYVRESAGYIIGQIGTPHKKFRKRSLNVLTSKLNDSSPLVRASIISSFGHLYDDDETIPEDITEKLLTMISDPSSIVRCCLGYTLGSAKKCGDVINALEVLNKDEDNNVASYAELGLDLLD